MNYIKTITMVLEEGPTALVGQTVTSNSWEAAEASISSWRRESPSEGQGYWKTFAKIVFTDDQVFTFRYDLHQDSIPLQWSIRRMVEFTSGKYNEIGLPSYLQNMTLAEYNRVRKEHYRSDEFEVFLKDRVFDFSAPEEPKTKFPKDVENKIDALFTYMVNECGFEYSKIPGKRGIVRNRRASRKVEPMVFMQYIRQAGILEATGYLIPETTPNMNEEGWIIIQGWYVRD